MTTGNGTEGTMAQRMALVRAQTVGADPQQALPPHPSAAGLKLRQPEQPEQPPQTVAAPPPGAQPAYAQPAQQPAALPPGAQGSQLPQQQPVAALPPGAQGAQPLQQVAQPAALPPGVQSQPYFQTQHPATTPDPAAPPPMPMMPPGAPQDAPLVPQEGQLVYAPPTDQPGAQEAAVAPPAPDYAPVVPPEGPLGPEAGQALPPESADGDKAPTRGRPKGTARKTLTIDQQVFMMGVTGAMPQVLSHAGSAEGVAQGLSIAGEAALAAFNAKFNPSAAASKMELGGSLEATE